MIIVLQGIVFLGIFAVVYAAIRKLIFDQKVATWIREGNARSVDPTSYADQYRAAKKRKVVKMVVRSDEYLENARRLTENLEKEVDTLKDL